VVARGGRSAPGSLYKATVSLESSKAASHSLCYSSASLLSLSGGLPKQLQNQRVSYTPLTLDLWTGRETSLRPKTSLV
jgi:hypothetical protein